MSRRQPVQPPPPPPYGPTRGLVPRQYFTEAADIDASDFDATN